MTETTFQQINDQLAANQPATVLVERGNGSITTGQIVGLGENGSRVFFTNLNNEAGNTRVDTRTVGVGELSDEHQEKLAAELAGVALRGAEASDTEQLENPKVDFYQNLVDGTMDDNDVEAAAVRPEKTNLPPAQTSHRPGYWTKPTQERIENAAKSGFDLTQQNKYFE